MGTAVPGSNEETRRKIKCRGATAADPFRLYGAKLGVIAHTSYARQTTADLHLLAIGPAISRDSSAVRTDCLLRLEMPVPDGPWSGMKAVFDLALRRSGALATSRRSQSGRIR